MPQPQDTAGIIYVVVGDVIGVAVIIVATSTAIAMVWVNEVFKDQMKLQKKWHYLRRLLSTI